VTSPGPWASTAVLSADDLARCAERLAAARPALAAIPDERLLAAWNRTVEAFLDPRSPERRAIQGDLVRSTGLSPAGLEAGLESVLGGVRVGIRGRPVEELFAEARALREGEQGRIAGAAESPGAGAEPGEPEGTETDSTDGFALVVLASNLPALAVQPLVAALAARRPVLLKSPTAEPVFAAAFVRALAERLPALGGAVAAVTWPGGDAEREAPVLARATVVVAYGGDEALADLAARARTLRGDRGTRFVPYGPKTSLAVVGRDVPPGAPLDAVAAGLARDVALFDQRGCLSVAAVYVEEDGPADPPAGEAPGTGSAPTGVGEHRRSRALADALARELRALARRWPPGPIGAAEAAAVQQMRAEAELRGLYRPPLALREGTVVVEPDSGFQATPGLRTVPIHPLPAPLDGACLTEILTPWRDRLQGVALAGFGGVGSGTRAEALTPALAALGVSRITPPGALQSPDARWHNGGVEPLAVFL